MRDIAIVSIARTPVGRATKGNLRDTRPDTLGAIVVKEALARAKGVDPESVGDIVIGTAFPEGEQGMNVARLIGVLAGLPYSVPAMTVNRFCSSGLQAIAIAAGRIALGGIDIAIAGGVESMSIIPMTGTKPSLNPDIVEQYPEAFSAMGNTAEIVAKRFDVPRQVQDEFACNSHMKAVAAMRAGKFKNEIVPISTKIYEEGGARNVTVSEDELPRPETTVESLSKLRPAFYKTGTVTAGNSSPLSDGAAAAVLMTVEKAKELNLKPLGIIRHFVVVGVPPDIMGIGPIPAIRRLMEVSGLKQDDIDVYEVNEAFAAQAAYCLRELELNPATVNPNGGAIALGHPLGGTGAILTAKLLYELQRTKKRYGVVSMCIGGGMGAAGLFERA
ncbi:MAG: thiolase family protein [Pseudomonadota bacterium]